MIRRILVLASSIGLLSIHLLYAQIKVYSLKEILQKTLAQYPSLTSKKLAVEQQAYRKELIRKEQLPEITVQAQQSYGTYQSVPGSFFALPGIYNISGNNKNITGQPSVTSNLYSSALLQWNFLQFGKVRTKLNVADAAIQLSTTALSEEELRLQVSSARQYFNVLQRVALLSVAKGDVQRLADLLDLSKTQANAGLRPAADTLLLKSSYLQSRGIVNDQQGLLETAKLELATLIGEDGNSFGIDSQLYNRVDTAKGIFSMDSLENHPYLHYLKANINYANASLKSVQRQPYPSIGLLAAAGIRGSGINSTEIVTDNLSAPWQNNTGSYLAGVGVTWNFSSLYQNKVKQEIAVRSIESAKADYQYADLQLEVAYKTAISRWKQQKEKVIDAKEALESSRLAYELYGVRYESGLINLIELLQLQKILQDAEVNNAKALGAYWDELINQSESSGNIFLLLSFINP